MALTPTQTPINDLKIHKFSTLADFQTAQQQSLIGQNEFSIVEEPVQADWNQTSSSAPDYIKNKPTIPDAVSGTNDGTNWTSLTIGSTTKNIPSGGGGGGDALYVEKTYAQLSAMVTGGTLVKGQKYRITDYITTTSLANTTSEGVAFDLVVTATDTNKLDCMAQAVLHSGDNYFSRYGADLSKWQVWYDIDNNTTKYEWADTTNGKGVIYRLIDEWGNDCPYDFKNIRFTISGQTANAFTFNRYTSNNCYDHSLIGEYCYENIIKPCYVNGTLKLNFNVFYNTSITSYCNKNTLNSGSYSNIFGDGNRNITFEAECYNNTLASSCFSNLLQEGCNNNTFGVTCSDNKLGAHSSYNSFGDSCSYNTLENHCHTNTFGDYCVSNTLGNGCNHIVFGNSSTPSVGGTYCRYNIVENGNQYIRLYQTTGTAGDNNQLQNVYIAQSVSGTSNNYVEISTISRNLAYRTTVAPEPGKPTPTYPPRIYCEDEITSVFPSMSGNSGKVLAVNSGENGVEWVSQGGGGGGDALYVEKTYAQLSAMVTGGTLVKGQKYRITDYITTTNSSNDLLTDTYTAVNAQAFDLVVTAVDTNKLDHRAVALPHAGDTYYTTGGAALAKWEIWYDINNDDTEYPWANTTANVGKGVIYRMIDEFRNDCPYDFKNIQFKRKLTDGNIDTASGTNTWVYTFNLWSNNSCVDGSLQGALNRIYANTMGVYAHRNQLPDNVFNGNYCYSNNLGEGCFSNTFGNHCNSNIFGDNCSENVFGIYCYENIFANSCSLNSFGDYCYYNTFGNNNDSFTLRNYCFSNNFGNDCNNIIFGDTSNPSVGGNNCLGNTIGNRCAYIRIYATQNINYHIQYLNVLNGTKGTSSSYVEITDSLLSRDSLRGREYQTNIGRSSGNQIVIWSPADQVIV